MDAFVQNICIGYATTSDANYFFFFRIVFFWRKKQVFIFFLKCGININTQVETMLLWDLFSIYDTVNNYLPLYELKPTPVLHLGFVLFTYGCPYTLFVSHITECIHTFFLVLVQYL